MRKLVFAALAGVFMLSSGFATVNSNDLIQEDFGTCTFTLRTTYVVDGGSYSVDQKYIAEAGSQAECDEIAAATAWWENFTRLLMQGL